MNKSIVKSCLLGLNSTKVDFDAFPKEIKAYLDFSKDTAETLLDALSLQTSFFQAGNDCTKIDHISESLPVCESETQEYVPIEVQKALQAFFSEGNYSLNSFLPLTIQKVAKTDFIINPDFIPSVLPLLNKELRKIKEITLNCFGKRAHWIYGLTNQNTQKEEKTYLDLSRAERTATFKNLLQNDTAEALKFLEEIYAAETPSNQLNYLKNNPLHLFTPEILNFIKDFLEQLSDTKATEKLKTHFQLMYLHFPESEWAETAFDDFFSKIWTKKAFLKNRKIVDKDTLTAIYKAFDNTQVENFYTVSSILGSLDQFLFFALVSVPFATWTNFLEVSNTVFIKMVDQIEPFDSPKYNKFSFQNALVLNAIIHQDSQAAEAIFSASKFEHATAEFLALFPPENLMEKVGKYSTNLKNSKVFVYDLDMNLFPLVWNNDLTKIALEQCLENITNSRTKLKNALWKIGPYINDNSKKIFNNMIENTSHSYTLKDDFDELLNIKTAFNNIKF